MKIVVQVDRPSPEVSSLVDASAGPDLVVIKAPRPLVSPKGENFLHPLNLHLEALEKFCPQLDWCYLADDDRWFDPCSADSELPDLLHNREVGMLIARSVFMWDSPTTYNAARHHVSPVMWRHQKGARWSGLRMIQAPDPIHDQHIIAGATRSLKTPLLDYGSYSADERQVLYDTFIAAGKDDPYISSLIERPLLETYPDGAIIRGWRRPEPPFLDLFNA